MTGGTPATLAARDDWSKPIAGGSKGLGMSTSPRAVRFDEDRLWVDLDDGRTIAAPLAWFPRLFHATREQLAQCELSRRGLHWEALDEDVSVAGLLAGHGDMTKQANARNAPA